MLSTQVQGKCLPLFQGLAQMPPPPGRLPLPPVKSLLIPPQSTVNSRELNLACVPQKISSYPKVGGTGYISPLSLQHPTPGILNRSSIHLLKQIERRISSGRVRWEETCRVIPLCGSDPLPRGNGVPPGDQAHLALCSAGQPLSSRSTQLQERESHQQLREPASWGGCGWVIIPFLSKAETGLQVTSALSITPQGDSSSRLGTHILAPLHLPVVDRGGEHPEEH